MAEIQRVPGLPVSVWSVPWHLVGAPPSGDWSLLGIRSCKCPSLLTQGGQVRPPCLHFILLCTGRSLCSEN